MKKKLISWFLCNKDSNCIKTSVKIVLSLMCLFIFSYSNAQTINLTFNNIEVKKVIEHIEATTNYKFFYQNNEVNIDRKITLNQTDLTIQQSLKIIFKGTAVLFEIKGNDIILKKSDVKNGEIKIEGNIKDISGLPLPGVNVVVKGTTIGTISDKDGNFTIVANSTSTLQVSFIGFVAKNIDVSNRTSIYITLVEEAIGLDEVVVVGYGKIKKSDLSTAVSVIKMDEAMKSKPAVSIANSIQGAIPGVTIVSNGGDPTRSASIIIRGQGNKNGDAPLWVVDGVLGAPVDMNNIETITVLKDAASAAIYGANAGTGGVIIVTTKQAKIGKITVSATMNKGIRTAQNLPEALNAEEYNRITNLASVNSGLALPGRTNPILNPWGAYTRTNWMDEIFRNALVENYGITISGGNDKITMLAAFNYRKNEGVLLNTFKEELSGKLTGTFKYNDHIKLSQTLKISTVSGNGTNTTSGYSGAIISAIYMPPSALVYEADGKTFHGTVPVGSTYTNYGDVINPVATLLRKDVYNPTLNLFSNTRLDLDIVDGLTFRSSFSLNHSQSFYASFSPRRKEIGKQSPDNSRSMNTVKSYNWLLDNILTYEKSFSGNNFNIMLGHTVRYSKFQSFGATGYEFPSEDAYARHFSNVGDLSRTELREGFAESSVRGYLARFSYNFKNRYFLIGSVRNDKSSKLYTKNQGENFFATAASWKISSEKFFNVKFIDLLKIRASWGQIGNLNSVGNYHAAVTFYGGDDGIVLGKGSEFRVNNIYALTTMANKELIWETSEQVDIGLDLNMFDNKINIVADYFKKETKNLIDDLPVSMIMGVTSPPSTNIGSVENSGFEFSINYNDKIGDVESSLGFNFTTIKNEVTKLGEKTDEMIHTNHVRNTLYPLKSKVGEPWHSFFLIENAGIFQSDAEAENYKHTDGTRIQPNAKAGDLKFIDKNGDGSINDEDKEFMGNGLPELTYGINASIKYKGFDLSVLIQGVKGVKIFNGFKFTTYNLGQQEYNRSKEVLNAWSPTNMNSTIPIVRKQDVNGNFGTTSDWFLENGDYLRIKNLTLGYSLPKSFLDLAYLTQFRVYVSAENIFTLTDYDGMTPEVGGVGIDMGKYPVSRAILVGINVAF